jgi:hypothetical protein
MGRRQRLAAELDAALLRWAATPFVWGASDCFTAVADVVLAARGYDPAQGYRGRYATARGAVRVTAPAGGFTGVIEAAAAREGWTEIDPGDARIGDVGLAASRKGLRSGIIRHRRMWVGRRDHGFYAVSDDQVGRAWRVT